MRPVVSDSSLSCSRRALKSTMTIGFQVTNTGNRWGKCLRIELGLSLGILPSDGGGGDGLGSWQGMSCGVRLRFAKMFTIKYSVKKIIMLIRARNMPVCARATKHLPGYSLSRISSLTHSLSHSVTQSLTARRLIYTRQVTGRANRSAMRHLACLLTYPLLFLAPARLLPPPLPSRPAEARGLWPCVGRFAALTERRSAAVGWSGTKAEHPRPAPASARCVEGRPPGMCVCVRARARLNLFA